MVGLAGPVKRWAALLLSLLVPALLSATALSAQDGSNPEGKRVYDKFCSQCHGDSGDGKGIATPYLKPEPRDFTSGKYKIRQTPTGYLPLDEDIKRSIQEGLPYSAMPAFPNLSEAEVDAVTEYIKAFSPDFEDPEAHAEPFPIPTPPAYTPESVERGKELYVQTGCGRCHGEIGYGDGGSAPTLVDDWGQHIRVADLSMPWTFRGGGTREDIFRTMSSGFNGTPMPGFHGSLPVEDIWGIVDYIVSLSGNSTEAPYANLLTATGTDEDLDLERADELFAEVPEAMFPLVGQIMEPGRNFYPQILAVNVQALYNREEIAFRLTWNDMRAETSGTNGPDLPAPLWADEQPAAGGGTDAGGEEEGGFWGDEESEEEEGGFWGDEEEEVASDDGGDFWGDEEASDDGGDDFWGEGEDEAVASGPSGPDTEFSDAVAIQFPMTMPEGVRRPYFIFGDAQNPVELWFSDLADAEGKCYAGRGSAAIADAEGEDPTVTATYAQGQWSVIFKRKRKVRSGISFEEGTFVPISFSVWDGFNRERGNKRSLTSWYEVYLEPQTRPSPVGPMVKAGLGVLALELLIIALVRRRKKKADGGASPGQQAAPSPA